MAARLRPLAEALARERPLTIEQARARLGFGDATAAEIGEQELER